MTTEMLLRAARRPGLKAGIVRSAWRKLGATSLPAVTEFKDGSFVPIGGIRDGVFPVQEPRESWIGRVGEPS